MIGRVLLACLTSLMLMVDLPPVHADGLLKLAQNPAKKTILSIGIVPQKKTIALDLGTLRTGEAQLPPAPLTREQRMAMRAKMAISRQRAVSNARRQRAKSEQVRLDENEEFPVDANGEPVMQ